MKDQLANFHQEITRRGVRSTDAPTSWQEAFQQLSAHLKSRRGTGKQVVFLDEAPWLAGVRSRIHGRAGSLLEHIPVAGSPLHPCHPRLGRVVDDRQGDRSQGRAPQPGHRPHEAGAVHARRKRALPQIPRRQSNDLPSTYPGDGDGRGSALPQGGQPREIGGSDHRQVLSSSHGPAAR